MWKVYAPPHLSLSRVKFSLKKSQARSRPSGLRAMQAMKRTLSCERTSSDSEKLSAFVSSGLLEKLANPALEKNIQFFCNEAMLKKSE